MQKALLLIVSTFVFILSRIRVIVNSHIVSNDVSQHHFWMFKFNEDVFHESDIIASFAEIIQPKAYVFLYEILLSFVEIKYAILTIEYLIFILTCLLLLEICKKYLNNGYVINYLLIIVALSLPDIVGGFARSFSFLIIIFPLYFIDKRYDQYYIGIFLILSAFLYPVSFLISAGAINVVYLLKGILSKDYILYTRKISVIVICCIISVYFLSIKSESFNQAPEVGKVIGKEDIMNNPIMGKKGRIPLKPQFESLSFKLIGAELAKSASSFIQIPTLFKTFNTWLIFIISLIPLCYFFFIISRKRELNNLEIFIISLLASGIILFFLARLLPFKLYMPTRYLEKTFPIIFTLICIMLIEKYFNKHKMKYVVGIFLSVLIGGGIYNNNFGGFNDYQKFAPAFELAKNTPKKSLIAAPPDVASLLPFFAKRSILVSEESCHGVYYERYRVDQMQKMSDLLTLYTTEDLQKVKEIINRYNIDFIIYDEKTSIFSNQENAPLFEPYTKELKDLYNSNAFANSYLSKVVQENKSLLEKNLDFIIVNADKLK